MLPPIGALTRPRPVTTAYLEAVQSNSISSVGFTLRSYASAARPHTPEARMPSQLPPSPGGRRALKTYLRQRKDHGREDNLKPERSGDGELTMTDQIGSDRPALLTQAANAFTVRHRMHSRSVAALMTSLSHDPSSIRLNDSFNAGIEEVRRNRLFVGDAPPLLQSTKGVTSQPTARKPVQVRQRTRFNLATSMWAGRAATGNSRDYYDTPSSLKKVFEPEWSLACRARQGFIQKLIVKAGQPEWQSGADDNGNGIDDEVDQVGSVLLEHSRIIWAAYDYYACSGISATNSTSIDAEHEIHNVCFNGFLMFVRDAKLASAECPTRTLELIFSQVDAHDESLEKEDRHNRGRMLNRQEWLQCLVRIALERYVRPKKIADISDAIQVLCHEDLRGRLPVQAIQDSNHFRAQCCYTEQMEPVLQRHRNTLQALYGRYSDLADGSKDVVVLDPTNMMSVGEWMAMLSHLGLFESGQCTKFEGKLVFSWSRLRAVVDGSDRSVMRARNLFFHDFVEAMIRLSTLCALPTDDDLAETGAEDAGVYLIALAVHAPSQFRSFVQERRGDLTKRPRQAAWRSVHHLLTYVARLVEMNSSGTKDMSISAERATQFMKRRASGRDLVLDGSGSRPATAVDISMGGSSMESTFANALRTVRERTLASLAKVPAFARLAPYQLTQLLDRMEYAPFEAGEHVFEQGDSGFTLYAVLSGTAKVVRLDEQTGEQKTLAILGEGDCFGELALLRHEARFATVKATSKLRTLSITRQSFESIIGSLEDAFKEQTAGYAAAPSQSHLLNHSQSAPALT